MRPPDRRHNSMARSTAQSEWAELSTGTKISRYTGTFPSPVACGAGPGMHSPSRRTRGAAPGRCQGCDERLECMSDLHGGPKPARRSEERRGGEEGRTRWGPDHFKKKKKE